MGTVIVGELGKIEHHMQRRQSWFCATPFGYLAYTLSMQRQCWICATTLNGGPTRMHAWDGTRP